MSDEWQQTACILCSVNCGIEVKTEDGHITKVRGDRAHPGSRGYACEKAQRLDHYQNGRHRLATPLRRRPDGSFEAIDWETAIREVAAKLVAIRDTHGGVVDLLLRRRRPGESSRRRLQRRHPPRPRLDLHLERAGAGEDRRVLGRRAALRPPALPHHRRLRARRGGRVRRQESLAIARLPARPRHLARDHGGPEARADRDRPAPHRDRRARRLPSPGAARAPTPSASAPSSACWCRRTWSTTPSSPITR